MGDQLEINTQYEIKKVAKENNIPFESFINKYGFSKEEPLMYFLSGDKIVSITWWAAKDQAKAQTTGFEQFKREVGLTFDYEKVSKQRNYVLSQQKKPKKTDNLESNEVAPQKRTAVPNYKSNNSDSSSNYDNGGTETLVFIIVLVIIIIFIVKTRDKKNSSGSAEKTNLNRTSTERSFDKEYLELDKMMLSEESYSEVYPFIKTFREKLRVGEIYLEEMTIYIKNNFSNYDGGKIMFIISLFEQMEHMFGTYLNEWEKKNNSKFIGFEDVEQYHTLSQKVIIVLQEHLQEQIENLGEKTKNYNSSSDTKTRENSSNPVTEIEKTKKNDIEIIKKLFPKLKGIDFDLISTQPKSESPEKFFNSDIDGKWFFTVHNFAMIFKSFSDENYVKGLSDILDSNGIDSNSIKEEQSHYYFQGDGFKIEKPKSSDTNLIIITNEDIIRKGADELRSFDKLKEVQIEWIKGIKYIYDGEDALSRFDLSNDLKNIVMHFKEGEDEYLLIHTPTSNIAKTIINDIVKKNNDENKFIRVNDIGEWENLQENNDMVIGYLPKFHAVRINRKKVQETVSKNSENEVYIEGVKMKKLNADRLLKERDAIKKSEESPQKKIASNQLNIDDEMPLKIAKKLYKKDMSGLQAYFKKFPNMEHIFNQFTHAIRNESTILGVLGELGLLNDKKIRKAAEKGFKDVSSFLEDMLKLQENTELRKDYEACVKALKILEKDLSSLYDFEKKVLKREKTIRKMYSDFLKSGIRTNSSMNAKELKVIENYKSTFKLALRSDLFIDRAEAIKIHLSEFWKTKNFSDLEKAEKI